MNTKQQFIDVLKKLKEHTGWSYKKVSELTKISQSKLKMAASGQSFNVGQKDVDLLQSILDNELNKKNAYAETPNLVAVPKDTLGMLEDLTQQLDEARKAIKKEADRIKSETQSIIDPTIKFIANKYDMSEEQIKNIFEKMLIEYLEKETKTNK